jgi:dihydrofolate reductase
VAKLVYSAIASLDGYVVDNDGSFDWAAPDEEVHAFVNDLERPIGTYLYGRRIYDVMRYWETADTGAGVGGDFARIWQAADKVVYSTTLDSVSTARTRLERQLDPAAVQALKAQATADISIGGPTLAGQALQAGLVDECHLFVSPVVVGGGTSWLPDGLRLGLELLGSQRFAGGVVHLHYRVSAAGQRAA